MSDELPSVDERLTDIMENPKTDPLVRQMFERLAANEMRRMDLVCRAFVDSIDENGKPKPMKLTREHGFTGKAKHGGDDE